MTAFLWVHPWLFQRQYDGRYFSIILRELAQHEPKSFSLLIDQIADVLRLQEHKSHHGEYQDSRHVHEDMHPHVVSGHENLNAIDAGADMMWHYSALFAIDTTTPSGKLMFQVTGAFAEFERAMIRSREATVEASKIEGGVSWQLAGQVVSRATATSEALGGSASPETPAVTAVAFCLAVTAVAFCLAVAVEVVVPVAARAGMAAQVAARPVSAAPVAQRRAQTVKTVAARCRTPAERKPNLPLPFCYPTGKQSMAWSDTGWTVTAKISNETGWCWTGHHRLKQPQPNYKTAALPLS
jgi:Resolvase, N terminal domain